MIYLLDETLQRKNCEESTHGCCPDQRTPAGGPAQAGCPSTCGCHRLGALADTCDPDSKQCACRPGVGGLRCDRCEPGYWGLPRIGAGHKGCIRESSSPIISQLYPHVNLALQKQYCFGSYVPIIRNHWTKSSSRQQKSSPSILVSLS